MKCKTLIAVCCALILWALSGCQLALENAGTNAYEDRLVGIFITTEYLDLFDFEGYLNDNISSFKDGEITLEGNTKNYEGRLYATLITSTLTNDETGETAEMEEYVFEGVEGIPYFSPTIPATAERDSYISSISDDAICDTHMEIKAGDNENSTSLKGTIYTAPSSKNHIYYFNPVFQSADGSIYTTSGSGFMANNESISEGSVYSQTLDASTTVTENGKAYTERTSITLSISVMYAPEKIAVLQMDADIGLLSRTEYIPDALPDAITLDALAEYIIVETHKRDDTGSVKISREIYDRNADTISSFSVREDGICTKHLTQINWK